MSGRLVNVRPKPGYVMDSGGNVSHMRFGDGLANIVTGLGTRADAGTARQYFAAILNPQQIEEAYEASWSLRKAIDVAATDRVRAWREWQAESDQIEAIEAEEERLQLQAKTLQCEVLRGLGGGAMILVGPGNTALPLNVTEQGGLVAINVVSRWHLTGHDWIDDLASPDYGHPTYWTITNQTGQTRIHPSRVVCFRGQPLPSIWRGSYEDRFWGRGRVPTLMEPAQNLDEALATFRALIKDARGVDIGVSKLLEMIATPEGEATIMRRLSLMMQGTSVWNGTLYDAGDAEGKGGERIDRHQVAWTGIPEIIRVYAEAMSAASDVPVTRFWGTSAKGLNATGEGDDRNWAKMVKVGQELELRPCLAQIDAALVPSAIGRTPPELWWDFAPLDVPSDKENTDRFKVWVDSMEKVQLSGAIPDIAFAKAYQNGLTENGWTPGLEGALAELPEDERYGIVQKPDPNVVDPSELTQIPNGGKEADPTSAGAAGTNGSGPARRAANDAWFADATPRPLYVQRKLLNAADLIAWAKSNGFTSTLPASDMHVTVLYSRSPVDPMKMGENWSGEENGGLTIKPGGPRAVEKLGENAVVLLFASDNLSWRHRQMVEAGGSHDYDEYQPHVTISYTVLDGVDLEAIKPFIGELRFGPEEFSALDLDWKAKVSEE